MIGKIVKTTLALLVLVPIGIFLFFKLINLQSKYDYERKDDRAYNRYFNGCPYPFGIVSCQWTEGSFSGFKIGMNSADVLTILCKGNEFATYSGPLSLQENSQPKKHPSYPEDPKSSSGYFSEIPCNGQDIPSRFSEYSFERESADWELSQHEEHLVLTFDSNMLIKIHLNRTYFQIDL